jgi:hypothetical protein
MIAPEKNTTDKMNMIPATITTHAAAAYSLGGLARGGGGGGAGATEAGRGEGSGVSLMP